MTRNRALSMLRNAERRKELLQLHSHVLASTYEAGYGDPFMIDAIEAALDTLPPEIRRILVAHVISETRLPELARKRGMNPGTCRSQLSRARARLRERLEGIVDEVA